jgi:Cu-processing system permease protein
MSPFTKIGAVASIEFRVALRNRWLILATGVMTLFSLALTFSGAGGLELKAGILTLAAASLATLSVYLIPLIALLISYDSIAGEVERGTMALVLATPISRGALLAGKALGLVAVLTIAIAASLAISSFAAIFAYGMDMSGLAAIVRLGLTGLLLGAVFVAVGLMISVASPRAGQAAAVAIGIWLVATVLYDLALLAGILADKDGAFTKTLFPYFVAANPGDAFRIFNLAGLENAAPVSGLDGIANTLPFSPVYALAGLFAWLVAALTAGYFQIRRLTP